MTMRWVKRLFLCVVLTLCSIYANAYNFAVDGIYYNVVSSSNLTCEVTYKSSSYNTYSGSVTIPETVTRSSNGYTYTVVGIGSSAFRNSSTSSASLTEVIIPTTVTYIDDYAFYYSAKLKSLTIPDGVTSIGSYAFYNCTSLTSLTIPDGVTSIGENAFYQCNTLSEITIPSSVVSIGQRAFYSCKNLTKVTLEDGEETLLMAITTTSLSYTPFYSCPIETLYLGRDMSYNSSNAPFRGLTTLETLTIGESVTNIGDYAFYESINLRSATIGNSVTSIESYAFAGCTRLTSIILGNSMTSIGERAFYECKNLASITSLESVTSIGNSAFRDCLSLASIIIGNGVTKIGNSAFYDCLSLASITSLNPEPPACSSNCFGNVPKSSCVLYVPEEAVDSYKVAEVWKDFYFIEPTAIICATADDQVKELYLYTIDGKRLDTPQKGINIIKYSDGTTRKVMIK